MASWDDEDFVVKAPPGATPSTWEDEVDQSTVGGSSATAEAAVTAKEPEQIKAKHLARERARKADEERSNDRRAAQDNEGPSDPSLRAVWLREQQEKSDLALARESFGVASVPVVPKEGADVGTLVAAITLAETDSYRAFGEKAATRVNEKGISAGAKGATITVKAMAFYTAVLKVAADKLDVDELKDLATLLDLARNKKMQDAKAKKKGGASKKAVKMVMERDSAYIKGGGEIDADYDDVGDNETAGTGTATSASGAAPTMKWTAPVDDFM